jgi:hypothetical protein
MAATLTFTGTATGLATDLTPYEDVLRPPHLTLNLAGADLESVPDEIRQVIDIFQRMWGAQIGSGKRLDQSVTIRMLELFLQAYKNPGLPRSGDRLA